MRNESYRAEGQGIQALRRYGACCRLVLNRNHDPAFAQAHRADNPPAADDIGVLGVQVVNIALTLALRALFIRAGLRQSGLVGHDFILPPQAERHHIDRMQNPWCHHAACPYWLKEYPHECTCTARGADPMRELRAIRARIAELRQEIAQLLLQPGLSVTSAGR